MTRRSLVFYSLTALSAACSEPLLQAQSFGVAIDATCEVGACTPAPLPIDTSAEVPLSFTYTLPNGDIYYISNGVFGGDSDTTGTILHVNILYQVTYEGNVTGATIASASDTLTMDFYESYATPTTTTNYTDDLIGGFSPNIGANSSVSVCWNLVNCFPAVFPYAPFDSTSTFPNTSVNGAMNFDETYTLTFGLGSPVGSYIVIGQSNAIAQSAPVIDGIADSASFTTLIAPGELASIFGSYLTDGAVEDAASLPLPDKLEDATVTVNGVVVPLLYVSPAQINFQVPFEAPVGSAEVVVKTNAGSSNTFTMPLQVTAPSMFQYNPNHAIAENADYSLNQASDGAMPGSYIIVFATGQGPVSNQPADGAGAPSNPLAEVTSTFSATINGENAPVLFAGMTPGLVGLLQMNITVPSDLAPGAYPLVLTVGTATSKSAIVNVQ